MTLPSGEKKISEKSIGMISVVLSKNDEGLHV
jgi:hypothetical protein